MSKDSCRDLYTYTLFSWPILLMYVMAMLLNVVLFSIPVLVIMGVFRNFFPERIISFLVIGWLVFYLLMLFFLFEPEVYP